MKTGTGLKIESLNSKKDFQNLMFDILNPLKPHYSEGGAELYLGDSFAHYDIKATYMEAVSRPLWALSPYWAGGGREEESNPFIDIYVKALSNGTDPENTEYWGECGNFDQRFVEMAAISYNLMYAPETIWDRLSDVQKLNLADYLYKINEHPLPVCNWILFAVMVNVALKERGMKYCPECKKTVTNMQAAERMKKFRYKNRMMNKAMKDRVQLLEEENELLRKRIVQLREMNVI